MLALIEGGVKLNSRTRIIAGCLGLVALIAATLVPAMARGKTSYVVGAKTFTEQYILSSLIAQRLQAAGLSATPREGLGSNVIFEALASGDIDVYVVYSGTLWANQLTRIDIKPRKELLSDLATTLKDKYGISLEVQWLRLSLVQKLRFLLLRFLKATQNSQEEKKSCKFT